MRCHETPVKLPRLVRLECRPIIQARIYQIHRKYQYSFSIKYQYLFIIIRNKINNDCKHNYII